MTTIDLAAAIAGQQRLSDERARNERIGELARRCLSLDSIARERGEPWPVAKLTAYGPDAAAFVAALREEADHAG